MLNKLYKKSFTKFYFYKKFKTFVNFLVLLNF